jgi:steroid delta-isomerase-like uncharacterized protein
MCAIIFFISAPATSQPQADRDMTGTRSEQHKALLTSFLREVWSDGDIERCARYLAETYTIHHDPGDPWEGQTLDLEGFKARVAVSRAPFRDQHFRIDEIIADADKAVATWHWSATHAGDYPGFPATGKPITMSGATLYYFDDRGRITGHWQVADRLSIYQQLQHARGA